VLRATNVLAPSQLRRQPQVVCVRGVGYTWDDLGRLVNDGTYTYTWDAASRLITVTDGISTYGFRYDGDGNRLARIVDGTLITHTLDLGLALPEVLVVYESGGTESYLHLPNAIAMDDGAAWSYSGADGLGTVRQELDASGGVASVNSYRPFGLPLEGSGGNPYGFTGESWEANVDLLYLRARFYAPSLNRFLSPDTIIPDYDLPPSIHPYSYVYNNPVNYIDPSGNQSCEYDPDCHLGKGRYILTNSHGWFDTSHFNTGDPGYIIDQVRSISYVSYEWQTCRGYGVKKRFPVIEGLTKKWLPFEVAFQEWYWVSDIVEENQVIGVAYAIYMDWSIKFEKWQGDLLGGWVGRGSSFAAEDLPSHHIGFVAAAMEMTPDDVVARYFAGASATDELPPHFVRTPEEEWKVLFSGGNPGLKNYELTPLVQNASDDWVNVPWPDELVVVPIPQETNLWGVVDHPYHTLVYWK
jgi:RHS repeat-associated protein